MGQIVLDIKPHHQPSGMPAAGNEAAERRLFGRLWVDVKTLRIEPFREGSDLACLDRDAADGMNVAFDIVLEVAIVDGVRKSREGPEFPGYLLLGLLSPETGAVRVRTPTNWWFARALRAVPSRPFGHPDT